MRKKRLIVMVLVAMLLMGCEQDHVSHSVVKAFIENNIKADDYEIIGWSKQGSTYHISDSMIHVMRTNAERSNWVNKDVKYIAKTSNLYFIQVKYAIYTDTIRQTFYLDDKLTGIVCFKRN